MLRIQPPLRYGFVVLPVACPPGCDPASLTQSVCVPPRFSPPQAVRTLGAELQVWGWGTVNTLWARGYLPSRALSPNSC